MRRAARPFTWTSSDPCISRNSKSDGGGVGGLIEPLSLTLSPSVDWQSQRLAPLPPCFDYVMVYKDPTGVFMSRPLFTYAVVGVWWDAPSWKLAIWLKHKIDSMITAPALATCCVSDVHAISMPLS